MRALSAIACLLIVCGIGVSVARQSTPTTSPRGSAAGSAQPADAQKVRAEIRAVENVLPKVPDRGAALFLLARQYAHLGELQKALAQLKECVGLDAGFDPDHNKIVKFASERSGDWRCARRQFLLHRQYGNLQP